MKRTKKILAVVLAALLLLSAAPVAAFATVYNGEASASDLQVRDTLVEGATIVDHTGRCKFILKGGTYGTGVGNNYTVENICYDDLEVGTGIFDLQFEDGYAVVQANDSYRFIKQNGELSDTVYVIAKDSRNRTITLGGCIKKIQFDLNADNAAVDWYDECNTDEKCWMIVAETDDYLVMLESLDSAQAAGNYSWDQLFDNDCAVFDKATGKDIRLTDGSCTVTVNGDIVTVSGTFAGEDGNDYVLNITNGHDPSAPTPIYNVTWKNWNGQDLKYTAFEEGTTPVYGGNTPTRDADAQYTYTFSGWSNGQTTYGLNDTLPAVTGETTYTATFSRTVREYTITWKNDDGTLIDTTSVPYGTVPTHDDAAKAATDEYTYTFNGWIPAPVAVTGEATYEATFTATSLTVVNAINLIDAIGTVTIESGEAIGAARTAYNNLTDAQKELVSNYSTLTGAEAAYDALAAAAVDDLIDAIGTVTLDKAPEILFADEAYERLTERQKELVTNYQTLADALQRYSELFDAAALEQAKEYGIEELENYVAAIDPADYRPAQQAELTAAINAALTTGKAAINAATDYTGVSDALAAAKAAIDAIPTDAQLMAEEAAAAAALADAKETLASDIASARDYYDSIKDEYPEIADDLDTRLQRAEAILGSNEATIGDVLAMTELVEAAVAAAKEAVAAAESEAEEEQEDGISCPYCGKVHGDNLFDQLIEMLHYILDLYETIIVIFS